MYDEAGRKFRQCQASFSIHHWSLLHHPCGERQIADYLPLLPPGLSTEDHDGYDGLGGRTATEIAEAVWAGKTSASDVVAEHLVHIRRPDQQIGTFVRVRDAKALTERQPRSIEGRIVATCR